MLTGRERVTRCLQHQSVDRVPRDLWTLPWVNLFQQDEYEKLIETYPMDISRPELSPGWNKATVESSRQAGTYKDEWGSTWYRGEPGVIGEVREPALADLAGLKNYHPPYELIASRDQDVINHTCEASESFMLSDVTARPFERLQFLRGTEQLFVDLAYGSRDMHKLLQIVHEYYLKDIEFWCHTSVDGILFMDDWGTNSALLISPAMWREIFKPLYAEYCQMIHAHDKYTFFHTDGHTVSIFNDFIDVGIDAVNTQLFCMDIEDLAKQYKGKITFWGEIDRQHVLPFGSTADVRAAVLRVRECLDDGYGGVIGQCEWGKNNPTENIATVFATWK